jgi:hypothetical protein
MRSLRRRLIGPDCRRRLCAGVTLAAYLTAALGVPLPAATAKDVSAPFPCQDHPCGCRTAEQCWTNCCCFTPEQRWAWARQRAVRPPDYAPRPSGHGWQTTRLRDRDCCRQAPNPGGRPTAPGRPVTPCCTGQGQGPSCCTAHAPGNACGPARPPADAQGPSCCTSSQQGGGEARPSPPAPAPRSERGQEGQSNPSQPGQKQPPSKGGARWGLGVAALSCQGQATLWAATGAALPDSPRVTWDPSLAPVGWLRCPENSPQSLPSTPPDPPPRTARA